MSRPSVWLALPHVGSISPWTAEASHPPYAAPGGGVDLHVCHFGFSIAPHTFNWLWAAAYNRRRELGLTHFAMMHADIRPARGWLDTLLAEMDRTGADVISSVVAIKDCKGLTSTGVREPGRLRTRRLTTTEVHRLPETFGAEDLGAVGAEGHDLVVNTGLWLARFDGDWPRDFPGFRVLSWLEHDAAADRLSPGVEPEDWDFSAWCTRRGLRVLATRAVPVWHTGLFDYPNDAAWGEWPTDREYSGGPG